MYTITNKVYFSQQINKKTVVTTIYANFNRHGQGYVTCGKGTARCHPNDTFVYTAGVSLSTIRAERDLYNKILALEEHDFLENH